MVLTGTLIKEVELKIVGEKNSQLAKFTLVDGKDENGQTRFYNCIAWRDLAIYANTLRKQNAVLIGGNFEEQTYTDRNGDEKTKKEFICNFILKQTDVAESKSKEESFSTNAAEDFKEIGDDEELPF